MVTQKINRRDVLISNNPAFLSFVADRPVRNSMVYLDSHPDTPGTYARAREALGEVRNSPREVYAVIEKRFPISRVPQLYWEEYLANLPHQVIQEDPSTIVVRLTK